MAPSSWHGVTTVVMGNCGVGFAPARPDRHEWLISLMEGVEDIPGTALAEGIDWDWRNLPRISRRVGEAATHGRYRHACAPRCGARLRIAGSRTARCRAHTADDVAAMSKIVEEGVAAGALGFSTSRTVLHKSVDGELVPGTTATAEELIAIGRAMARAGHGVFEMASDLQRDWNEFEWMGGSEPRNRPAGDFRRAGIDREGNAAQRTDRRDAVAERQWREQSSRQIALRGNGIIMAWRGSVNPFVYRPSWQSIAELPWDQQKSKLLDPAFKARLLSEENDYSAAPKDIMEVVMVVTQGWANAI